VITIGNGNVISFYFILPFCNKLQSRNVSATPDIQSFQFSILPVVCILKILVWFRSIYIQKQLIFFIIITFFAILYTVHMFYTSNFIFSFNIVTQCYITVYLIFFSVYKIKTFFYQQVVNLHIFTWYLQIPNILFLINSYLIYWYYIKIVRIFLSLVFNCNI